LPTPHLVSIDLGFVAELTIFDEDEGIEEIDLMVSSLPLPQAQLEQVGLLDHVYKTTDIK
jgi:hypothetical protein